MHPPRTQKFFLDLALSERKQRPVISSEAPDCEEANCEEAPQAVQEAPD
ncbi:hypothetical protein RchiOBHm_Chr2g0107411 [Rosa chinensis]|uniref:Uncharacterized protein n=1 Tax=Rosa chinensis TaxID=74649 RepID=A0A2P6RNY2_ROSCH|nr:hypothetical protein RchiOBHm_Chr2g0107411 [Rosa chinensis]